MTTVKVTNLSTSAFSGWVRVAVDAIGLPAAGSLSETRFVTGRRIGISTRAVDIHLSLAASQEAAIDLSLFTEEPAGFPALPADILGHFGGMPVVNGVPMMLVTATPDGACWLAHFRARTGNMLVHDLWCWWYPGQGWCRGEWMTTCSNPLVMDMGQTTSPNGVRLTWGDAIVQAIGARPDGVVVPPNTSFADGQARAVPLVFCWLRHSSVADQESARAVGMGAIWGHGIGSLLADGNPVLPVGFDARSYIGSKLIESVRRLHTWEVGAVGPNAKSGDTGAQEDQVFVRGEAIVEPIGVALAYLGALKMAARPCHHRELNGALLDPALHTAKPLIMWDGRPHSGLWQLVDRLGKPRPLSDSEASGWWGPDVEHWLLNTLAAGARLVDSPALQALLETQANLYRMQWTTTPGWSTSSPYAARAIGWEGIAAVHLWRSLGDRQMAERVKSHWLLRWAEVISPNLWAPGETSIMDVRIDDPRLGAGAWWIPWQQSVGAYGLDLAGQVFGVPGARLAARTAAQRVVDDAWVKIGDGWQNRPTMPVAGGGPSGTDFLFFGMSLAPAVVLRNDPAHTKAGEIWSWLKTNATRLHETAWLAPGTTVE